MQSMKRLRTLLVAPRYLQWPEVFRMRGLASRRLWVLIFVLTMVVPLGPHAQASTTYSLGVEANCCGANCPSSAMHNAAVPNCCASSQLPFSSSSTSCNTSSSRDPVQIARASRLRHSLSRPTTSMRLTARLWQASVPPDRLCSLQL